MSDTGENTETPQCEGNGKEGRHSQATQFEEDYEMHWQVILTCAKQCSGFYQLTVA
jgi:hypothetical protein